MKHFNLSCFILNTLPYFIGIKLAFFSAYLCIGQSTITGNIMDAVSGEAIIGATIVEKGTDHGTVSDFEGNFEMTLQKSESTIIVSYIGYQSVEITITDKLHYLIELNPGLALEKIVVTSLNLSRAPDELGYAMTGLEGKDISVVNAVNPIQALQGKSTGLSIGASDGGLFGNNKILLRGVSVLNSNNNQPIFVIDGVILDPGISNASADWSSNAQDFGNILKNINPDQIESVSVLKGAAATALYGSRGINGAIIIKNKQGRKQRGLGIHFSQKFGFDKVYDVPELQYEYGPGTYAGIVSYGETNDQGQYYRFDVNQVYRKNINGQDIMTKIGYPSGLGFGPKFDGRPIEDYDNTIGTFSPSPNAMKDLYDVGFNSNTSFSISGSNENGQFYLSHSYNTRTGVMPTDEFNRNALLFSGRLQIVDWLSAETSLSYTLSNAKNPGNDLSANLVTGNWLNWYDSKKWKQPHVYQAIHGGVPSTNLSDPYSSVPANSIWFNYFINKYHTRDQVTRPIVRLSAQLTELLSLTAEVNMNIYHTDYEKKVLGQNYKNEGGSYELKQESDINQTSKLTLNFHKNFEALTTNFILGGEVWRQEGRFNRTWTTGGLVVPGQFFIENSKRDIESDAKIRNTKQINSIYYLASLGWKDQLYLDITGRNDWSSALIYTDQTGHFSYFYPSISSSWLIHRTLRLPSAITYAKLRLSWAQVGNDTNPYVINKGYSLKTYEQENGGFIYGNSKSITLVDANIKPERKNAFEIGTDIKLYLGRLGIDVTYYHEAIKNQIGNIPVPVTSGYNSKFTNIGTLTNKGIELSLKVVPIRLTNFEWSTTFNYWNNKTLISHLIDEVKNQKVLAGTSNFGNFRIASVAFENGEYGVLVTDSNPLKNDQGQKILTWNDQNRGAYYTRSGKEEKIGKINPDFEGSLLNEIRFKDFSFSFLIDSRFGGHLASYSNRYGTAYGRLKTSLAYRDEAHGGITWTSQYNDTKGQTFHDGVIPDGVFADNQIVTTPSGELANVGGMTYAEAVQNGLVEPTHASYYTYFNNAWSTGVVNENWFSEVKYIALRSITFRYTLPKALALKVGAQNIQVSVNGQNIAYLYNSLPNNLHPESYRGTSSDATFLERSFMPYYANYNFGLSIDF